VALESEFEAVQCERDEHLIAVTTRPNRAGRNRLGPISDPIELAAPQEGHSYVRGGTRSQSGAGPNDSITHPTSVTRRSVKEMDAGRFMRAGRRSTAVTFFTIVDRLLNTYASGPAPMWSWTTGPGILAMTAVAVSRKDDRLPL